MKKILFLSTILVILFTSCQQTVPVKPKVKKLHPFEYQTEHQYSPEKIDGEDMRPIKVQRNSEKLKPGCYEIIYNETNNVFPVIEHDNGKLKEDTLKKLIKTIQYMTVNKRFDLTSVKNWKEIKFNEVIEIKEKYFLGDLSDFTNRAGIVFEPNDDNYLVKVLLFMTYDNGKFIESKYYTFDLINLDYVEEWE